MLQFVFFCYVFWLAFFIKRVFDSLCYSRSTRAVEFFGQHSFSNFLDYLND